ncbi:hypothetical protein F5X97DRAFT_100916 [Nemania serpens]|nr:hypothetical protein F5X97DRAFT_100916 [Nemania serpens]
MATISFPSLTAADVVEHGLWCKGCEWTYNQYTNHQLSAQVVVNMVPIDCHPDRVLSSMTSRAC